MGDGTYHTKTCNSRRGPQYPCDCSHPEKPTPSPLAQELGSVRERLARDIADANLFGRETALMLADALIAAGVAYRSDVIEEAIRAVGDAGGDNEDYHCDAIRAALSPTPDTFTSPRPQGRLIENE